MILFPFRQNSFSDETAKKDNHELDQEYNLFDTPPINLQRKMIYKRKRGTKFKANISQSVVEYFLRWILSYFEVDAPGCTAGQGQWAVRHQAPVSCHLPIIITKQACLQ